MEAKSGPKNSASTSISRLETASTKRKRIVKDMGREMWTHHQQQRVFEAMGIYSILDRGNPQDTVSTEQRIQTPYEYSGARTRRDETFIHSAYIQDILVELDF